jgi:Zn-dependent protease
MFRIRGIRIGVDYSWFFILFLSIFWLSGIYKDILPPDQSSDAYVLAVVSAFGFFGSILLHELGHALVAIRRGIAITDITLWMFGGVARMSRDSDSAGTEFKVAIAGPLVTLAIAGACVGIGIGAAGEHDFWQAMRLQSNADVSGPLAALAWLASINVLILVFNLIPAFPLDGGRIARAIVWRVTGDRNRATRSAAILGKWFSYGFIGLGLFLFSSGQAFNGIWLALIGWVLSQSARGAIAQTEFASRIEGISVADVMDSDPVTIPDDASVERALDEYFLRYRWPWFPVVDAQGKFIGVVRQESVDSADRAGEGQRPVGEVMEIDAGDWHVGADASLESVLASEPLRRIGAVMAVDRDGILRGVVTLDQVRRALQGAVHGPAA